MVIAKNKKTCFHTLLAILIAVSVIVIFLISSFEIGAYGDFGFYEKEYTKYKVADELDMEMSDIMEVTRYMMSYLRGNQEVLSIETTVEGTLQDFFNEQDRFHMEEVQGLFLGGLAIRRAAVLILIIAFVLLMITGGKWQELVTKMYQRTLGVFLILTVVLGILFSQNFTKYFVIFHQIFFDNDLWIFDPDTDYMIRMLPEGFFYDMVMRIGVIFIGLLLGMTVITLIWQRLYKKNK